MQGTQATNSALSAAPHRDQSVGLVLGIPRRLEADALAALLQEHPKIVVVEVALLPEHIFAACRRHRPSVVILDSRSGAIDSTGVVQTLAACQTATRVVLLVDETQQQFVQVAQLPQRRLVPQFSGADELCRAIMAAAYEPRQVVERHQVARVSSQYGQMSNWQKLQRLSLREREVLVLLASGKSAREAARLLNVSVSTIDNHRSRLKSKLGVRKAALIAKMAAEAGWVT